MLFRFSLYGFLKNQQYYEPFLLLALLDKGLSFTQIGLLIGFREICINVMEIPTGAIADVMGRRKSMIFSFLAYIGAFLVFGLCQQFWTFFAAMFLFSIGEAFRTGTHKAMIFDWLTRQGRANEKTKIYGFTRSWSKLGSALSAVIAAVLVFTTQQYSYVFLFCILPYILNIINFLTYPTYLDNTHDGKVSLSQITRTLYEAFRDSVRMATLRRLFVESMCFEGTSKVCKDYLQTTVQVAALALPLMAAYGDKQRTAVLVAPVFLVLYLLSSWASRHAHVLADKAGDERKAAKWLWGAFAAVFVIITVTNGLGHPEISIPAFILLALLQNFWRPILISRFADHAEPAKQATILSIESQGKSIFTALIAPLVGLAVDSMSKERQFLPVGLVGLVVVIFIFASSRRASVRAA